MTENKKEDTRLDAMVVASHIDIGKELTLDELADILDTTVKFDWGNKIITFLVMLGTFTDEEQSNILYKAESSTGKSYIPLEVIQYFPDEDVVKVSYSSPTAFYHKHGTPFYEEIPPAEIEVDEEEEDGKKKKKKRKRKKIKHYLIDMSKKIYVFKDMPSDKLLVKLRSLLSHDEKEMQIEITDKSMKYGFRARKVIILGYPTFIFCTASPVLDAQESTRFFVLSPDIATEKIEEGIRLAAKRKGNKPKFLEYLSGAVGRHYLQNRIRLIKSANIYDVVIKEPDEIADKFIKSRKSLNPRHMRDFVRLLSLIKYWAIFNHWNREKEKINGNNIIYANEEDIKVGFQLYWTICDANEMGVSPEIYQIYKLVFDKFDSGIGLSKEEISANYLYEFHRPLSQRRLNKYIIPSLLAAGLIYKDETTGKGGKPLKYKLTTNMDISEEGLGIQTELGKSATMQDKMETLLKVLIVPMKLDNILRETNGLIKQENVSKLLQQLISDGKIYKPSDYTYQRVI